MKRFNLAQYLKDYHKESQRISNLPERLELYDISHDDRERATRPDSITSPTIRLAPQRERKVGQRQ